MYNYQKYRHIQPPGWTLGWAWRKKEVIWSMVGSQATEQGDYSKFKGNIPHGCKRHQLLTFYQAICAVVTCEEAPVHCRAGEKGSNTSEGMEVSAEMEFLSQQNIMLDLENKALKQRLESLNQEQLVERFQQEMFEREVAGLRNKYQQQQQMQQQQQTAGTHSRSSSRDLDSQFASLSLKHKEPPTNSGREPVSGPLRI